MDQDTTWYAGRPSPRRHCNRWGPISSHTRGTAPLPLFGPLLWHGSPSQQLMRSCYRQAQRAYIAFTLGSRGHFFRVTVRTHTRKMGEIAPGVPPQGAKTCFVFLCYQGDAAFRPLILHRFWPFLKQQTWIALRMHTLVKISKFLRRGFSTSQKHLISVLSTLDSMMLVIDLEVKGHISRRSDSFSGLDDIPTMCLLHVPFAWGVRVGRYKPPKKPNLPLLFTTLGPYPTDNNVFLFARWRLQF